MAETPIPQDADDTRRLHFRRLARHPVTLILAILAVVGAGVVMAATVSPLAGLGAAVGALLLTVVIVFLLASGHAEEDFFRAYAEGRGLARQDRGALPAATPLLRKGDDRYGTQIMRGQLPGGIDGALAQYTYEETSEDSKGNRQTTYYHFTVALTDVPECKPHLRDLYCQRKVGFRFLEGVEDIFRSMERVELESEELDSRFEIFAAADADQNWLRQLFSPTFIVWLAEEAPEEFAFELADGVLCANVTDHLDSAMELDALCGAAAGVAARLRQEATETAA